MLSDRLNNASQADAAFKIFFPKPVTVDWTQEVLAETDDAASAASTTRDITSLLLGSLAHGRHAAAALRAGAQARRIGILKLLPASHL